MKRDMLEVVDARPPNYAAVVAALPAAAEPGVMFAYDGKVYYPGCGPKATLTRELDAHERVHIERQGAEPDEWWSRYLSDTNFRYVEELLAHRAEYRTYCRRHANPVKRYQALRQIARRLASELYGAGVSVAKVQADIVAAA